MSKLLLARHGETEWNALGKLQGHTDIPLNEAGRAQARALAEALGGHGLTAVCTSDLARARETGAIVAAALGLPPPATEPALRERRFGVFEGKTRAECAAMHPEAWRAWQEQGASPPEAEEHDAVVQRMEHALRRLAARAVGATLVVSHGGVMRLWLQRVSPAPVPLIGNGATFQVDWSGPAPRAEVLLRRVDGIGER
ncbi:MAG: histidine phosphatase family protein [Kofleriaceae bacterium]